MDDGGRPTVLVVEDEAILAVAVHDELADAGYAVAGPFASCAAAIAALDQAVPAVAIVDAVLVDGSCVPLVRDLQNRRVPIMVYSGAFEADIPELRGLPRIDKPAAFGEVAAAIRGLVSR
ncbi:response regulator [Labrys wisconsinensis]|uniref:DNA-binding response OmpR family regulator n=1 Tax=Labrys wisconsinensis TaxID=425677 RepID=A0ABU0JFA9_9HYPH|nr:response regulator [Labrys wisconsinensis]MDQ0472968.1 DNA-binding response OmpR family regulator [Labrys wisconsinensis]